MPLCFNHVQDQTTFYRNTISDSDLHAAALVESTELIGLEHSDMTFHNWCFEGFRLAYNVLGQQQPTSYSIKNDIDAIKIYFNKRGRTEIGYKQLSKNFTLGTGQFNMLYSAELDSQMSHIDNYSEMFSLQLTKECFRELTGNGGSGLGEFADKTAGRRPALFSNHWMPMNGAMEKCIHDIVHCHFARDLKTIYLHAKAIELFVLFAHACSGTQGSNNTRVVHPADREKLYFAKDYLLRNYANPVSLSGLSKATGLNEFKLKKGFKELFNTTVIDFLINYRLEQAYELLLNTTKNISEVAYESGYASPAYFSKAFKKKYGINPTVLRPAVP